MLKVSIATLDQAPWVIVPEGLAGVDQARALFAGERHPIHLHAYDLSAGETLTIGPREVECLAYVGGGAVVANGVRLDQGSSAIVERGGQVLLAAADRAAQVLVFSGARRPASLRPGGMVHLLPCDRIPHIADIAGSGVGGGLHADGRCEGCELWLHENHFPALFDPKGVHGHTEDEIIYVTHGSIGLGRRSYGPGTALAIAAQTFYGFNAGPEGLRFINFRATLPREIFFQDGTRMDETAVWQVGADRPLEYVAQRAPS